MRQPGELGGGVVSGSIIFKGMNLLDYSSHDVVYKLGISLVPEGRRVFGNLQVFYVEKIAFLLIDRSNQLL